MAQPQPQTQPPAQPMRAWSPGQTHSPSPAQSSSFALPPNKRPRTDGQQSQPGSPYPASPYAISPPAGAATPGSAGSPTYTQTQNPQTNYPGTPGYTNGASTPTMALPDTRPSPTPQVQTPQPQIATPQPQIATPQPQPPGQPQYTGIVMAPIGAQQTPVPVPIPNTSGAMGPPQRPAERPQKELEYDYTDSLAGTGIDLRAEEQYLAELYSNSFDEARTGFGQQAPGPKGSFYGSGTVSQPSQSTDPKRSQQDIEREVAEKAWYEASANLAVTRANEIKDPFLLIALLHRRAEKITKEHHLSLNLEMKNNTQSMGKMRLPDSFPQPSVTVSSKKGADDSVMVQTTGSFVPQDAYLVDQLALLSIATKSRLRDLVGDAQGVAIHRQTTSHGEVPEEWTPAAGPLNKEVPEAMDVDRAPTDGQSDTGLNPLKRSADAENRGPPLKMPKIGSYMTTTMRDMAKQEREWEEARLRRRQKRKDGVTDTGTAQSRAGSAAPGTPGSVAPEEKSLTKKEMKKAQAAKSAEASSHASQNMTSSMFAGLGGRSLFGKKKTGKTYDWMNVGRGNSGTSTPVRGTPGLKGTVAAAGATPSGPMALTTEGRNRLGTWREDKEKGRNIQLRDWVAVLERDGREHKALQLAYDQLDVSGTR